MKPDGASIGRELHEVESPVVNEASTMATSNLAPTVVGRVEQAEW